MTMDEVFHSQLVRMHVWHRCLGREVHDGLNLRSSWTIGSLREAHCFLHRRAGSLNLAWHILPVFAPQTLTSVNLSDYAGDKATPAPALLFWLQLAKMSQSFLHGQTWRLKIEDEYAPIAPNGIRVALQHRWTNALLGREGEP